MGEHTHLRKLNCSAYTLAEADQTTNATAASTLTNLLKNTDPRIRPNLDGTSLLPAWQRHDVTIHARPRTYLIAGGSLAVAVGFYIVSFGSISEVDMVSVDAQLQLS